MTQFPPPLPQEPIGPNPFALPRKNSGAAIASMIVGILGCVPFIAGITAIILAILGFRQTRRPEITGRGFAVAGLILGILSIGGWSVFSGVLYFSWSASRPLARQAELFINHLEREEIDEAAALASPSVQREELVTLSRTLRGYGKLTDLSLLSSNWQSSNGMTTWELSGSATFGTTHRTAVFKFQKEMGVYKITSWNFE